MIFLVTTQTGDQISSPHRLVDPDYPRPSSDSPYLLPL